MNKRLTAFHVVNGTLLTLLTLMMVYPFVQTLLTSFASYGDVVSSRWIALPKHFNFDSYLYLFSADVIVTPFLISFLVTVCGTVWQVLMTALGAYVLSSRTLPFRRVLMSFLIFTMFFGGGLIPFVLVIQSLGMINSYFGLIIPFSINSFNLILLRNFMRALPYELIEAAKMDGAGELKIMIGIVMPLSVPALATISLYYAVGLWNDWYWPMIILEDSAKYPLALALKSLISNSASDLEIEGGYSNIEYLDSKTKEAAVVIISIIPVLVLYPFIQKFFVNGVVLGAVKG